MGDKRLDYSDDYDIQGALDRDPVGYGLGILAEQFTELVEVLAIAGLVDETSAEVIRATMREVALAVGYQFFGEVDPSKFRPRDGIAAPRAVRPVPDG